MMKGKITQAQKRKIYAMTRYMSARQLQTVVEATSHITRQIVQKNKKATSKTKSQLVSGLNKRIASEVIQLLTEREAPETREAYNWLARNENKLDPKYMRDKGMDNSKKRGKDPMSADVINAVFGSKQKNLA